jgi:hypothetical protein
MRKMGNHLKVCEKNREEKCESSGALHHHFGESTLRLHANKTATL